MRILYYVPDVTQKNGGIRQYACALLKILAQDNRNEYIILHNAQDDNILSIVASHSNLTLIPPAIGREKQIEKAIWYTLRFGNELLVKSKFLRKVNVLSHDEQICNWYKIDLVYCPYQYMPETTRKTIATLHDVQELHFPEFFTPSERLERALIHKNIAEKSTMIVVSYEHVKQDLITYFQRAEANVLVCLLAMQNLWFDKFLSQNKVSLVSYHLPQQFIFYPAVTWPHKNHISLLKALAYLKSEHSLIIDIVFTGHQTDFQSQIEQSIEQLGLKQQVHLLGVVSEEVLYALYHATRAVVVPTLYEAGSFPLMESILMRIPVVCSNVTSLPDAIGDERYVFNPLNIEDMADKVNKICFDESYRLNNIENSVRQGPKLKNTDALNKLETAIREIGNSKLR